MSEIANQSLNKDLFDRTCLRKSKRSREKKHTQILASKLNRAIEKSTPDVKSEIKIEKNRNFDEQSVKEKLIQAGVYIDDDNELLIELVQGTPF